MGHTGRQGPISRERGVGFFGMGQPAPSSLARGLGERWLHRRVFVHSVLPDAFLGTSVCAAYSLWGLSGCPSSP